MNDFKGLKNKVICAAIEHLHRERSISPLDILIDLGFLHPAHLQEWKRGHIPFLEYVLEKDIHKISYVIKCFRRWAKERRLTPKETLYHKETSNAKHELQFTRKGRPQTELFYRTHYISPYVSEKKKGPFRERSLELLTLVLQNPSHCSECGKGIMKGSLYFLEEKKPLCLSCGDANVSSFFRAKHA